MNQDRFLRTMQAVDDDLLEEAMRPVPGTGRSARRRAGLIAACLLVAVGASVLLLRPQKDAAADAPAAEADAPMMFSAAPAEAAEKEAAFVTAEDLAAAGYDIPVPAQAENLSYELVDRDGDAAPMAVANYTLDGAGYTCTALRTDEPEDLTGDSGTDASIQWNVSGLAVSLAAQPDGTVFTWYIAADGIQWSLVSEADADAVLTTAQEILQTLGFDLSVAPEGAEDVHYAMRTMEELSVAEIRFTLDGVQYVYRMAGSARFADLSGIDAPYETETDTELGWCQAKLLYTDGGAGKILWYDVAPGVLYSLSMDTGASEEALQDMALALYTPLQDDVG